jgi:hypothetical protein
MPNHEPSLQPVAGRAAAPSQWRRAAVCGPILAALWLATTGCNSIYHRAQKDLPVGASAQLTLYLEEARQAEALAEQAGTRLRNDLRGGVSGEALQADLDRLELAALDLQRRVLTARDVTASSSKQSALDAETEQLCLRSRAWLDYVQAARKAGPAVQVAQLDALLRSSSTTPTSTTR